MEKRDADHADVSSVRMFLVRIRILHRAEAERGDCLRATPKAIYRQLAVRSDDIPSLCERSFTSIEHVETIYRQQNFEAEFTFVSHHDRVSPSLLSHNEPPVADNQTRQKTAALVA